MPPPVEKFQLAERTWGTLPLAQTPSWAQILANPNYGSPNGAGTKLIDLVDGTDPQDAVTVSQLDAAVVDAYAAIGFIDPANAACQTIADWTGDNGGVPTVQVAAGGSYGLPRATPGANSIRIRTTATGDGAFSDVDTLYPYKEARTYATLVALKVIDDPGAGDVYKFIVGFPSGTDTALSFGDTAHPIDQWLYLVDHWTAPADAAPAGTGLGYFRDSGDVGGTADLYVGYQQIVELPSPEASLTDLAIDSFTNMALSPVGWRMYSQSQNGRLGVGDDNAFISGGGNTVGVDAATGILYHFAEHTPGDLAELGHEFDVGDDYVPVYLSEKDSSTAQLYAGSGFVLELAGNVDIDCGGAP